MQWLLKPVQGNTLTLKSAVIANSYENAVVHFPQMKGATDMYGIWTPEGDPAFNTPLSFPGGGYTSDKVHFLVDGTNETTLEASMVINGGTPSVHRLKLGNLERGWSYRAITDVRPAIPHVAFVSEENGTILPSGVEPGSLGRH